MEHSQQRRELILLSQAEGALAKAQTVDDVLTVRDQAEVARALFRKAKVYEDELFEAATIRLRAERMLGEQLGSIELARAAPGNQHTGKLDRSPDGTGPTSLVEIGISKNESSRAQQIASIPVATFEEYLEKCKRWRREPSVNGALRLARSLRTPGPSANGRADRTQERPYIRCLDALIARGERYKTIYAHPS